ncbi:MAG: PTS sugar transporter subunit IIA [Planctomycetes bacterium]|nr:PTS sugar transporter subunit IIA [Planctomycetota bacterium]MCH7961215.1 PTS sugar transporter subunit IIA [Planctomycetota bacterium]MCH9058207.1 PTS sugar transporter subunit IIA [Planctomycetota bacterium]
MKLLDLLSIECVKAPLESTTKQGVIDELVDLLAGQERVRDAAVLKEAVWTREQTRTTGIGHGLAIPHGKCEGMSELSIAIGKPNPPMDFEAIDGQPVSLVVLLASPPDRTSDHIQALALISRLISVEEFREQIYSASTAKKIFELLKGH